MDKWFVSFRTRARVATNKYTKVYVDVVEMYNATATKMVKGQYVSIQDELKEIMAYVREEYPDYTDEQVERKAAFAYRLTH